MSDSDWTVSTASDGLPMIHQSELGKVRAERDAAVECLKRVREVAMSSPSADWLTDLLNLDDIDSTLRELGDEELADGRVEELEAENGRLREAMVLAAESAEEANWRTVSRPLRAALEGQK